MFRVKNVRGSTVAKNSNFSPAIPQYNAALLPTKSRLPIQPTNPKVQYPPPSKNPPKAIPTPTKNNRILHKQIQATPKQQPPIDIKQPIVNEAINKMKRPPSRLKTGQKNREKGQVVNKINIIEGGKDNGQEKELQQMKISAEKDELQNAKNKQQEQKRQKLIKQQLEKQRQIQIQKQLEQEKKQAQLKRQKQEQKEKQKQKQKEKLQQQQKQLQLRQKKLQEQHQSQQKQLQQSRQQIARIMERRKQRELQRSREKQHQFLQEKKLKQFQEKFKQNHGHGNGEDLLGGMMYTNDPLAHFEFPDLIMDLQINKILKTSFNHFTSGQAIQAKKADLQRINTSYLMIRSDPNGNQRMKQGLNNYRTQLFNEIGYLIMQDQKNPQTSTHPTNFTIIQASPDTNFPPQSQLFLTRGIPKNKIPHLLTITTKKNQKQELECAICLIEIQMGQECYEFQCGHCFHEGCSEDWVVGRGDCPVCRRNLKF